MAHYLNVTYIRYLHKNEDVHGVTILTECAWYETIVVWVNNRGVKDTINL
jgi:hypothetical protein